MGRLKQLLNAHNNRVIINSDLDGFLCGLLFHHYFNSKIIGFSNGVDKIWIDQAIEQDEVHNAVYVDMFVADETVATIDNHIIAVNEEHWELLKRNPNKINPNLLVDEPHCFSSLDSYKKKYCLATFHFLCGLVEKEVGEKIHFDLDKQIGKINKLGDLLLRADKVMFITLAEYPSNAREWWKWLKHMFPDGIINEFIEYLGKVPKSKEQVYIITANVSKRLRDKPYCCDSNDGGYKQILDKDGSLLPKVRKFIETLAKVTGLNCFHLDRQYNTFGGESIRIRIKSDDIESFSEELINNQTINGRKVFSYSFVNSIHSKKVNFSCTTFNTLKFS